jgi:hypothetical protein
MEFHVTVVVPAKMPPTSPPTLEDCANGEADLTRCSKKLEEWLANPSDDGSMKVHFLDGGELRVDANTPFPRLECA